MSTLFIALLVILLIYNFQRPQLIWFVSLFLALPYFVWLKFFNSSLDSGFLIYKLGWLSQPENWFWFWIKKCANYYPLCFGTLFFWSKRQFRFLIISGWILFALVNLIQFQPNLADNNKFLVWWYLLALIYPTLLFITKIKWSLPIILVVCTLTGVLQLLWILQNRWQFVDNQGLSLANFAKTTCVAKRWLTSDAHNHPVFTFAGRPLVMGYRGWLWTWGTNFSTLEKRSNKCSLNLKIHNLYFLNTKCLILSLASQKSHNITRILTSGKNCTLSYTRHQVILSLPFHRAPQTSHCSSIHIDFDPSLQSWISP